MNESRRLLLFLLDGQRYGLPLECVERVVPAVEITPLPNSPQVVLGVINVQGRVIAAVDPRRRLGLPPRELELDHQLILARTARRRVAMLVDGVTSVTEYSQRDLIPAQEILPGPGHVAAVMRTDDGLVLIQDLDRFLSLDEELSLDEAMVHA